MLKILILFRAEKDDVFHTVFKVLNACLAFPILFLTSSSVPPLSVTMLPRDVNLLSSSISFPSAVPQLVVYCSPLVVLFSVCLFPSLSFLLTTSICWTSFAFVCVNVIVDRCHLQNLDHQTV